MPEKYAAIKASYDRCCESEGFLETFYEHFFAKSPEIPRLFAHTDFERQHKVLRSALWQMVMYGTGFDDVRRSLRVTAEIHSRQFLDIKPELYALWLDSLCEAIAQHDPQYTLELEQLWREAMQKGIDLMVSSY